MQLGVAPSSRAAHFNQGYLYGTDLTAATEMQQKAVKAATLKARRQAVTD